MDFVLALVFFVIVGWLFVFFVELSDTENFLLSLLAFIIAYFLALVFVVLGVVTFVRFCLLFY